MKRIKTGENYPETLITLSENVSISSTAKLPNCHYNKSSIKTRSFCNKRIYVILFSSVKSNA